MPTNILRSDAPDIVQEVEFVLANAWVAAETITLTIDDIDLVLTIGTAVTIPDVLDNLVVMVSGSGSFGAGYSSARNVRGNATGVFSEVTATEDDVDTLTFTARVAGKPFTVSKATTSAAGTIVQTTTVANSSKSDWENALNWSLGIVPVAADDVILEESNIDMLFNLDQSAVAHNSITVRQSFTGRLGLPEINNDGSIAYAEYRDTSLKTASLDIKSGTGEGTGSGRIKIDSVATNNVVIDVQNTGSAEDTALGAFIWKGTGAGNIFTAQAGEVGLGVIALDNATISVLDVIDANVIHLNGTADATNVLGTGTLKSDATIVDLIQKGDATTTLTGVLSGAGSSIVIEKGTVIDHTTGAVIDLTVMKGGIYDLETSEQASRTVTNKATFHIGSDIRDPLGLLDFTAGYTIPGGERADITATFGKDRSQYDVA